MVENKNFKPISLLLEEKPRLANIRTGGLLLAVFFFAGMLFPNQALADNLIFNFDSWNSGTTFHSNDPDITSHLNNIYINNKKSLSTPNSIQHSSTSGGAGVSFQGLSFTNLAVVNFDYIIGSASSFGYNNRELFGLVWSGGRIEFEGNGCMAIVDMNGYSCSSGGIYDWNNERDVWHNLELRLTVFDNGSDYTVVLDVYQDEVLIFSEDWLDAIDPFSTNSSFRFSFFEDANDSLSDTTKMTFVDNLRVSDSDTFIASQDPGLFTINYPTQNEQLTASTTSITFDFDYNNDTAKADFVNIELVNLYAGVNTQQAFSIEAESVSGTSTSENYTITINDLDPGIYQWVPQLIYTVEDKMPLKGKWIDFRIGDDSTLELYYNQPPDENATTTTAGIVSTLMRSLFVPSPTALNHFQNTHEDLKTKIPFVYAYDFQDAITTLYNTTQTESATISYNFADIGTMTLLSEQMLADVPYASTIKSTLGYVAWLLFGMLVYRRTLTIFDLNTQTL